MRSGKMTEVMRGTLISLLNEVKSSHLAYHLGSEYRLRILFNNSTEGENFKELLFSKLGFHRIRVELNEGLRYYCIVVTWNDQERDYLIKNIEEYLQEDNMGPTNIDRENTKFYAIVEDAEGKKTAYEITHSSLETRMEYSFGESNITHTVEFDQDYMRECECVLTRWLKLSDEVEKLKAEKDALAKHLGKCEDQLRMACEYLNGYEDVDINIPKELKDLNYFNKAVNYTIEGKIRRREFGKNVAKEVKEYALMSGAWRTPKTAEMMSKDNKVLEDAVETAINPFCVSSYTMKADNVDALSYSALLCRELRLKLDSVYGITAVGFDERIPKIDIYDRIKDVKFANPATIVFWKDGTKTVVKAQGDEEYVPEVGLAMCICKKVMGNTRDYYRVFKHWMKKVKED